MRLFLLMLLIVNCAASSDVLLKITCVTNRAFYHGSIIPTCLDNSYTGGSTNPPPAPPTFPIPVNIRVVDIYGTVYSSVTDSSGGRCRNVRVRPAVFQGVQFMIQATRADGSVYAFTDPFQVYKFPLRPLTGGIYTANSWIFVFKSNFFFGPFPYPVQTINSDIDILRFTAYDGQGVKLGTYDTTLNGFELAGQMPTSVPKLILPFTNFQNAMRFTLSFLQQGNGVWTETPNGFVRTGGTDSWSITDATDPGI